VGENEYDKGYEKKEGNVKEQRSKRKDKGEVELKG
jgi:hypothetical protein